MDPNTTSFIDFEDEHSSSTSSSSSNVPNQIRRAKKKAAGRKKFKETRHPVYIGVRRRNGSKWVCEVREPNKKSRIWLGTFPTPEMAARAYDVAVLTLRGDSVALNFDDSAWCLIRAETSSSRDIQIAAFRAAEAFRPMTNDEPNLTQENQKMGRYVANSNSYEERV
ncbi:hypothetical protein M9H77_16431 [Catharanthus roseus]|uniref:Uncharacterized protein n=1 Tax=Catharanthus roseus TaxID=4058 RepID=A0ACC0B232_CATRO|nr:hypothetical protein M9H77_16431 [Catharanthus roseus]UFQ90212.1 C-repeat binding factor 3 [Catharanthus roseus]